MTLFVIGNSAIQFVREPQYPHLITMLSDSKELLLGAHPGGDGAICETVDGSFPYALHLERWALPREFWALREHDIPRLPTPLTPEPVCWRYEGLWDGEDTSSDTNPANEVVGFCPADQRATTEAYLTAALDCVAFYPWFEDVCISSQTPALRYRQ